MFLWSFSAGIVNISLPTIAQYLDVSTATVSWIIIFHLLVLVSLLLFFGRLADYKGHKTIFMWGVFIFILSSYMCGISTELGPILIYRLIQGIGSAMLLSVAPAIISKTSSAKSRGRAFGYISLATTLGLSSGYLVGGIVTEYTSWNWIFFLNIPIGIMVLLMARKFMPSETITVPEENFDKIGAIISFLFFLSLILAVEPMGTVEFPIFTILVLGGISLFLGLLFIFWELRHPHPLIDLKLFLNPYLSIAVITGFLTTLVLTGTIFLVPFYLELVKSYSTEFAGTLVFLSTLLILIVAPMAGWLTDKYGAKKINIFGAILLIISIALFTLFDQTAGLIFILIVLALRALSDGISNPANSKIVISHSPQGMENTISSLLNNARYLGLVMGVVVFQTIFNRTITQHAQTLETTLHGALEMTLPVESLVNGFQTAFFIGIILSIVIVVLTIIGKENLEELEEILEEK